MDTAPSRLRLDETHRKRLRATISRMMSLVPSQISSSFASRSHFCDGRVAHVACAAERLARGPRREERAPPTLRASPSRPRSRRACPRRRARQRGGSAGAPGRASASRRRAGTRPPGTRGSACRTPRAASRARPRARAPRVRCRASPAASCTRARSKTHISPREALPLRRRAGGPRERSSPRMELAGREAAAAHLRQARAAPETLVAVLDDERGDPLRAGAGRRPSRRRRAVGDVRIADELLVAVEHVAAVDAAAPPS